MREVSRYRNRFDKLEERQVYCPESRVVEHFGRGREDKLAQVIIKPVWVVRKQVKKLEWDKFSDQRKQKLIIFSFYFLKASSYIISLQGGVGQGLGVTTLQKLTCSRRPRTCWNTLKLCLVSTVMFHKLLFVWFYICSGIYWNGFPRCQNPVIYQPILKGSSAKIIFLVQEPPGGYFFW